MEIVQLFISFCCLFAHTSNALDYKKQFKLQNSNLCTTNKLLTTLNFLRGGPKLTLGDGKESAIVITQVWNSTNLDSVKLNCKFMVETREKLSGAGVYAVITKLKFRKNPVTNSCIDYIEFSEGRRSPSRRICDDIGDDDAAGQLIFDERERGIRVHVSIDKHVPLTDPLELALVITSHFKCSEPLAPDEFVCDPKDSDSCISHHFVNDGISNCMPPCNDEGDCFHQKTITAKVIEPSNIAITAFTSLIFTMIGVGTCIWLCWKYTDCISAEMQQNHQNQFNVNLQTIELSQPPYNRTSAPSFNRASAPARPPSPKMDMPPSYEELFPDR